MDPAPTPAPLCQRCNENAASQDLRSERVCSSCFMHFIGNKTIKRLEFLQRETRGTRLPTRPQKYLVALSHGVSSTALVHILNENLGQQRKRNRKVRFEVLAVHVDAELGQRCSAAAGDAVLEQYRAAFPEMDFRKINLEDVLGLTSITWSSLPTLDNASGILPAAQLVHLFNRLPSTTSRADAVRLLIRHLLVSVAAKEGCDVLLLGTNTTALAELTLSETAKGRGFSLPWQINDGTVALPSSISSSSPSENQGYDGDMAKTSSSGVPIYHPLRELFRKELLSYAAATSPPLTDIIPGNASTVTGKTTIVSHKDISIEDVMARYFGEVEEHYPSVVANVVRTTGKLRRAGAENGRCGLCGIPLDDAGDERWRGELGEAVAETYDRGKLCYGCDRSIYG